MSSTTTTPRLLAVRPAARHARLTRDHATLLLGREPRALHRLVDGTDASDAVVSVDGPNGNKVPVRVLLPFVERSVVYLCGSDADALGFSPLATNVERSPGLTIAGNVGSVLLQCGALSAERVVLREVSSVARLVGHVDVHLEGERPRLLRNLPVEQGAVDSVYVVDGSGDLRPGTVAHI